MTAIDARSGDIAFSLGYSEEYVRVGHVVLILDGGDKFDNLSVEVILKYQKGDKTTHGAERKRQVLPFLDEKYNAIDFVTLLFAHAQRHGLFFHGHNERTILAHAWARNDKRIEWAHTKRPVFNAFHGSQGVKLDLGRPIHHQYGRSFIRKMAYTDGLLMKFTKHDLRRGGMNDLSRLDTNLFSAVGIHVAEAVGHSHATLARGTTDNYVGNEEGPLFNEKAKLEPEIKTKRAVCTNPLEIPRATTGQLNEFILQNVERLGLLPGSNFLVCLPHNDWGKAARMRRDDRAAQRLADG